MQNKAERDPHSPLTSIAARFAIGRPIGTITPLGRGLINETFSLEAGGKGYVLQRINASVFPQPERVMANRSMLNRSLAEAHDGGLRIPSLVETLDGETLARDAEGGSWRMMELIANAHPLDRIERPKQAHQVGLTLGRFHRFGASLPTSEFGFCLPGFHQTERYLEHLLRRLDDDDVRQSTAGLQRTIEFIRARETLAHALGRASQDGSLPLRITHGDPKLDNILFDRTGDRALALIDLDTVQPGLIQHDLGDCLRSCCNRRGEGSPTPEAVRFDAEICREVLEGYAEETRDLLGGEDVDRIFDGIRVMPLELGLRFLIDHLEGDRYFRVEHPGQNLEKASIQFALVADIERQERMLRASIETAFQG